MSYHPNVFLVGAPKCGTTTIAEYLSLHPRVVVSNPKEPLFFCEDRPNIRKFTTFESYLSCFASDKTAVDAVVDASVWYLYSEAALRRIQERYPTAKIVICLRNPVDFCQSLYWHQRFAGNESCESFMGAWREAVEKGGMRKVPRHCAEPHHIIYPLLGKYYEPVLNYLQAFGRENVLIVFQEDLAERPDEVLARICAHIGTEYLPLEVAPRNAARVHKSKLIEVMLKSRVKRPLYKMVRYMKSWLRVPSLGIYRFLLEKNSRRAPYEKLDGESRKQLVQYFDSDVQRLDRLVGNIPWREFHARHD